MRVSRSFLRVAAVALLACGVAAHADTKPKRVKYVPPEGFNGHVWGELRTSPGFADLQATPVGVAAAFMRPVETEVNFTCMPMLGISGQVAGEANGCDFMATLNSLRRRFEGGGFYVLSEYTVEDQAVRFGGEKEGVLLYPVVYQFCANWDSTKPETPKNFDEVNQFCGVRLVFKSETLEKLRELPDDHVTQYDRVLETLLVKFGKPDKFSRLGRVVIETLDGVPEDKRERKFLTHRWCPAKDRGLHTSCKASVVLALDPVTGVGNVLFSTPLIWEYAYARENYGFKGDPLFKVLHARKK